MFFLALLIFLAWLSLDAHLRRIDRRAARLEWRLEWQEQRLEQGLAALGVEPADPPHAVAVRRLVDESRTVEAVRTWRDATGASLKHAKAHVDSVEAKGRDS